MTDASVPYVGFCKDRRGVQRLWERFNAGLVDDESLAPYHRLLFAEWQRCRALGVDVAMRMGHRLDDEVFCERLRRERQLLETAMPILREVGGYLGDVPGIIMLADGSGTLLYVGGDAAVRDRAATLSGIVEGSQWNEATAGSNGVGTAIALRHPVHVYAAEHLCEGWHTWTCAGAPIFDADGRTVLGVVDFTTIETDFRDQALGLSVSLASAVQARLALQRERERQRVLVAFGETARRYPNDDLVALDVGSRPLAVTPNERCRLLAEQWGRGEAAPPVREAVTVTAADGSEPIGRVLVLERPADCRHVLRPHEGPPPAPAAAAVGRFGDFVTADPETLRLLDELQRIAAADVGVLLVGETGTGKDLLARHLHAASPRCDQPYLAVNCGAISEHLMESAFFGYVRGAFSGADPRGHAGYFESAAAGTLFLDEVGELPPAMQAALLRVLEDGSFQRVGSCRTQRAACRVIAATHRDLGQLVAEGRFRSDLYFRLKVVQRTIKPLRERPCDVALLAERFAEAMRGKHGLTHARLSPRALQALGRHRWPGNIRELRNAIESALLSAGGVVEPAHLPPEVLQADSGADGGALRAGLESVRAYERQLVIDVLRRVPHVNQAAGALGIARSTLYRKFAELGIRQAEFVGRADAAVATPAAR